MKSTNPNVSIMFLGEQQNGENSKLKQYELIYNDIPFLVTIEKEVNKSCVAAVSIFTFYDKKLLVSAEVEELGKDKDYLAAICRRESNGRPMFVNMIAEAAEKDLDLLLDIPVELYIDFPELFRDIKRKVLAPIYEGLETEESITERMLLGQRKNAVINKFNAAKERIYDMTVEQQEVEKYFSKWITALEEIDNA